MTDTQDWFTPASSADMTAIQQQLATVIANTTPINNPIQNTTATATAARSVLHAAVGAEAVVLYNPSTSVTVWIGGSGVTAANGIALGPGAFHSWSLKGQSLYGITSSASVTLQIAYASVT